MNPSRITDVQVLDGDWLRLSFSDGAIIDVDAGPIIRQGGVFKPIEADRSVFEAVAVSESGTIEWPGEIDICPDVLYGRGEPECGTRFERRVVRPASALV